MIPKAYKDKELDLKTGITSLLELSDNTVMNSDIDFTNDTPLLSTALNLGHASGVANASLALALAQIFEHRYGQKPEQTGIDIQKAELGLSGALISKVNNKNFVQSMYSIKDTWILYKKGILKGLPLFKINKTKDNRWFHTHPNFNCENIQKVIGTSRSEKGLKQAIGKFNALELENSIADEKAIGAIIRTPEEWLSHPHGKQLFERPVVEIEKISDNEPCHLSQLPLEKGNAGVLNGLKVLDLSRVLAGPNTTQILSEYGAECLKISHPKFPYYPFFSKIENRGKRSAFLDLKSEKDKNILYSLIEEADIFVSAYNKEGMRKLGLDPTEVAKRSKKGIIYVSISCYGSGSWENREGFDSLAQATTGFTHLHSMTNPNKEKARLYNSEKGGTAPEFIPSSVPNDYITGYLAVYGALVGLLKRQQEGGSYTINVSLAQSAMWTMRFGLRNCSFESYAFKKQIFPISLKFEERVMDFASKNYDVYPSHYGNLETVKTPISFGNQDLKSNDLLPTPRLVGYRNVKLLSTTILLNWEEEKRLFLPLVIAKRTVY